MQTIELPGTMTMAAGADGDNSNWFPVEVWSPEFKEKVNAELDRLGGFEDNWNSEGAPAIDKTIIESARALVEALPENIAVVPAVVPMANRNLQFEWHEDGRSLELEFETAKEIRYLKWDPRDKVEEEDSFAANDFAQAVRLIRWFTRATMNA